jgi:hypothetical protein
MCVRKLPLQKSSSSPATAPEKLDGGAVIMMPENLIVSDGVVNDRPVGKPQEQGLLNIAASFSLSNETKVINPVGG